MPAEDIKKSEISRKSRKGPREILSLLLKDRGRIADTALPDR